VGRLSAQAFSQLAFVETRGGPVVALAQVRDIMPAYVTTNYLYAYDPSSQEIAQTPFQTITAPHISRHRYMPVVDNFFLLLIYHVSNQAYTEKSDKTLLLRMPDMDRIFYAYCHDLYLDGMLDVHKVGAADLVVPYIKNGGMKI
jgi:hypothetical protein